MGTKDLLEKQLFSKNDVFSSVWNELDGSVELPSTGKNWLDPDDLAEASPELVAGIKKNMLHRFRDVLKVCKDKFGLSVALLGLENQTEPEEDMAIRVMLYDAMGYFVQSQNSKSGTKIVPIFTRVLYFGYTKRWNTPRKLSDLCVVPPNLASRFQEYKIEVIELAWLTDEQIERLTGDLKVLAIFLRKIRLKQIDDWPKLEIKYMSEILQLLYEITGQQWFEQQASNSINLQRRMNMCELFEKYDSDLIEQGRKLGLDEGKKLGLDEGKKLGLDEGKKLGLDEGKKLGLDEGKRLGLDEKASSIARNLIAMSMPEDDIAKVTGLSLEEVQALIAS